MRCGEDDFLLPADRGRERHCGDDLSHQRAFLALVAPLDGGHLLHVAHPLPKRSKPPTSFHNTVCNFCAGEALLHLIPERQWLLAAHADDSRLLLLLLAELEEARRLRLRWPTAQAVMFARERPYDGHPACCPASGEPSFSNARS